MPLLVQQTGYMNALGCPLVDSDHAAGLLSRLNQQRQQPANAVFCDCVVRGGSSLFLAHRAVLAASSPILSALLPSAGPLVHLQAPCLSDSVLGPLLDYIYTGALPGHQQHGAMLVAATYLQMEELQAALKECSCPIRKPPWSSALFLGLSPRKRGRSPDSSCRKRGCSPVGSPWQHNCMSEEREEKTVTRKPPTEQQSYSSRATEQQSYSSSATELQSYSSSATELQNYSNGATEEQSYSNRVTEQQSYSNRATEEQSYSNRATEEQSNSHRYTPLLLHPTSVQSPSLLAPSLHPPSLLSPPLHHSVFHGSSRDTPSSSSLTPCRCEPVPVICHSGWAIQPGCPGFNDGPSPKTSPVSPLSNLCPGKHRRDNPVGPISFEEHGEESSHWPRQREVPKVKAEDEWSTNHISRGQRSGSGRAVTSLPVVVRPNVGSECFHIARICNSEWHEEEERKKEEDMEEEEEEQCDSPPCSSSFNRVYSSLPGAQTVDDDEDEHEGKDEEEIPKLTNFEQKVNNQDLFLSPISKNTQSHISLRHTPLTHTHPTHTLSSHSPLSHTLLTELSRVGSDTDQECFPCRASQEVSHLTGVGAGAGGGAVARALVGAGSGAGAKGGGGSGTGFIAGALDGAGPGAGAKGGGGGAGGIGALDVAEAGAVNGAGSRVVGLAKGGGGALAGALDGTGPGAGPRGLGLAKGGVGGVVGSLDVSGTIDGTLDGSGAGGLTSTQVNTLTYHHQEGFKCSLCSRGFSQHGSLNRHMRSHLGVRPYRCPQCPMNFSRQYRVTEHMRVHQRDPSASAAPARP